MRWDALEKLTEDPEGRYTLSDRPLVLPGHPHADAKNVEVVHVVEQSREKIKPKGIWYACGNEWVKWLRSEMPEWGESVEFVYELHPSAEVIRLTEAVELRKFTDLFGFNPTPLLDLQSFNPVRMHEYIDWPKVAKEAPGIEICPYQWSERMSLFWYYGWDVASGCIWNPKGIDHLELVATREDFG